MPVVVFMLVFKKVYGGLFGTFCRAALSQWVLLQMLMHVLEVVVSPVPLLVPVLACKKVSGGPFGNFCRALLVGCCWQCSCMCQRWWCCQCLCQCFFPPLLQACALGCKYSRKQKCNQDFALILNFYLNILYITLWLLFLLISIFMSDIMTNLRPSFKAFVNEVRIEENLCF